MTRDEFLIAEAEADATSAQIAAYLAARPELHARIKRPALYLVVEGEVEIYEMHNRGLSLGGPRVREADIMRRPLPA